MEGLLLVLDIQYCPCEYTIVTTGYSAILLLLLLLPYYLLSFLHCCLEDEIKTYMYGPQKSNYLLL